MVVLGLARLGKRALLFSLNGFGGLARKPPRLIVAIYGLEENGWSTKDLNRGSLTDYGPVF